MAGNFALLDTRRGLRIAGPEARDFLQGLISNDVVGLGPERPLYAALLTPQGKYLFDFILFDAGDAILLDAEAARLAELKQRLSMYRLRAKVLIEETGHRVVAAWDGPCPTGLAADPRLPALGWRGIFSPEALEGFAGRENLTELDGGAYDLHRLSLGVPDGSRDLVPQRSLLLESNFVELNGVSFGKGCYVGQELTARTHYRGLVKKRLLPVRAEGALPAPGTILMSDGREAGEMRSGRESLGLALLRLEPLARILGGEAGLEADGVRLRPELPAWLPRDAMQ